MRILITNDDGIHAPGLAVLATIAREISADVTIVAPETDQSGVSHSLSLSDPLRLREVGPKHFAVRGTPTDCVIMGVKHIMKDAPPDLILSGINRGQNVADDVTYSGTIAAAMEGTILGIPSIALSQAFLPHTRAEFDWSATEAHGVATIRKVIAAGIPAGIVMNVNFPSRPADQVKGIAVCVQGKRNLNQLDIEKRIDARANPYYWLKFGWGTQQPPEGTDLHAMLNGKISVTPLKLDLTDLPTLTALAEALEG